MASLRTALLLALLMAAAAATASSEQLPVQAFTTADGLGSTYIIHLKQDSRGFLWFGTRDGLSRFDGYGFTTYNTADGLPSPTINHVLETRGGVYWVATNGGGLARFDPRAAAPAANARAEAPPRLFQSYRVTDDLLANRVNVLYEDRAGRIWVGSDGGLFRLEESEAGVTFQRIESDLPSLRGRLNGVDAITEDAEGSLWVGTDWGVFRRAPDGRSVHYTVKPAHGRDKVGDLLIDRGGRVWVGHYPSGLIVYKPEPAAVAFAGGSVTRALATRGRVGPPALPTEPGDASEFSAADGLAHDTVRTILEMPDGVIWIGTAGGLTRFDGLSFRSYTAAHGLKSNAVSVLAGDRDGNIWLGSPSGVLRLRPNGLVTYAEADGLGHTDIHGLLEDETGAVLAVSGQWFVNRFDGRRFDHVLFPIPAEVTLPWSSRAVLLDRAGAWWVMTNEGLFRFAKSAGLADAARRPPEAVLDSRHGLPGDSIISLFEDSRGDVWISARPPGRIGLARWERATGALHTYSEADGFGGDLTVQSFAEDGAGRLWLGAQEGGLLRYEAGRFTLFPAGPDGLPVGLVTSLHVDGKGRLWVATAEGGLGRVDDLSAGRPQFRVYTVADGIASNNIRCLVEDLAGRIYLGTVRGVDRLDPWTGRVRHYTAADGLANDFVKAALRDRRGMLWFGTMNGLSSFAPDYETPPPPPPTALIEGVRVAGTEQPVPELGTAETPRLELTADQNNIQIDFFGIGLSAGEVLRYQSMIEGAGDGWGQPTAQRSVNLHLAPGSYRFLVRAVNADGAVSAAPALAAFTIHPPFWQQWWFQTLAAALFLTVLVVFERYRAARVKELNISLDESQRLKEKLRGRVVELGKVNRTLALEYHLTRVLGESETLGEAAPHILHAICESAEWEIGTLWELDEAGGVLRCVETSHLPEGGAPEFEALSRESAFAPGEGLPGRVWQSREPDWVTDLSADENFPRIASAVREGLRSAYAFPVLLGGRVTGVLEFFSREIRQPDEEMIKWISAVGSHIGQLIERMRTEEALGRAREERLRELQRVRTRIASDLHDDIGSSLTKIVILSEVAHQKAARQGGEMTDSLSAISGISNELVEAMSDIVWAINPKRDHLSDLTHRMRRFASDILTARGIKFHFSVPDAEDDTQLGANVRREVFLIFKESVNNIFNHTRATEARAEFGVRDGRLTLRLTDNGEGFDPPRPEDTGPFLSAEGGGGNGLASMRKRAAELGGDFRIRSAAGRGTTVVLTVPVGGLPSGNGESATLVGGDGRRETR